MGDLKKLMADMKTKIEDEKSSNPSISHIPVHKVILPMLRRVLPTLIANEIVGIQPMFGPRRHSWEYQSKIISESTLNPSTWIWLHE
jgi:hypothetical protein